MRLQSFSATGDLRAHAFLLLEDVLYREHLWYLPVGYLFLVLVLYPHVVNSTGSAYKCCYRLVTGVKYLHKQMDASLGTPPRRRVERRLPEQALRTTQKGGAAKQATLSFPLRT